MGWFPTSPMDGKQKDELHGTGFNLHFWYWGWFTSGFTTLRLLLLLSSQALFFLLLSLSYHSYYLLFNNGFPVLL